MGEPSKIDRGAVRPEPMPVPLHPTPELTAEDRARVELIAHRKKAIGNYWCWQGDGEDHPESLTCPVLVSADQVREWVAGRTKAFEQAAEAVNNLGGSQKSRDWNDALVASVDAIDALATEQADG